MARSRLLQMAGMDAEDLDAEADCPAATKVYREGVPAIYCGIEQEVLDANSSPQSFVRCTSQRGHCYTDCPTWRAMKEATWARRKLIA